MHLLETQKCLWECIEIFFLARQQYGTTWVFLETVDQYNILIEQKKNASFNFKAP